MIFIANLGNIHIRAVAKVNSGVSSNLRVYHQHYGKVIISFQTFQISIRLQFEKKMKLDLKKSSETVTFVLIVTYITQG